LERKIDGCAVVELDEQLIDRAALARARAELGNAFARILGYFREDGPASVRAIEMAMRDGQAAAIVVPAHTLKGEARQFGAHALGDAAERIEDHARRCVERHEAPDEIIPDVAALRTLFERTMSAIDGQCNPVRPRQPVVFGRRSG
jgi:HPt (histidine-containing phosphotransfer) domain-containing protein